LDDNDDDVLDDDDAIDDDNDDIGNENDLSFKPLSYNSSIVILLLIASPNVLLTSINNNITSIFQ